jgi:polysaccharide export outer membrane protein
MQDPPVYPGDIVVVDGSHVKALQKQLLSSIPLLAIFGPL